MSHVNLANMLQHLFQVAPTKDPSPSILLILIFGDPSRVSLPLGYKYYATFIDDIFRCTWVVLLMEFCNYLMSFRRFVNDKELIWKSNSSFIINAKEYFSTSFNFLASQGITHQSSYAYTQQQKWFC